MKCLETVTLPTPRPVGNGYDSEGLFDSEHFIRLRVHCESESVERHQSYRPGSGDGSCGVQIGTLPRHLHARLPS